MSLTKTLGVLVVLIIIALGIGYFVHPTSLPTTSTPQEQHVLMGQATTTGLEYATETNTYTIDVLYPAKTSLADAAADQKARLTIETELKTEIDNFTGNVAGLDATVLPSLAEGYKLMMVATYKSYAGASTVSYFYTLYEDTGGAHPNTFFKTFTFDEQGNELGITDVVGQDGLGTLSKLATADVTAQLKTRLEQSNVTGALFSDGLKPTAENFQNFLIDGNNLLIEIPPYQVAAYAVGSFEVKIPLSQLK